MKERVERSEVNALKRLARLYGIERSYVGVDGLVHEAPPETLLSVLRALGASVSTVGHARSAVWKKLESEAETPIAPVHVSWEGADFELELGISERVVRGGARGRVELVPTDLDFLSGRLPVLGGGVGTQKTPPAARAL